VATFINNNDVAIEILAEDEANLVLANSFYSINDDDTFEHGMLVDSVQFLALGGLTLGRVAAQSLKQAAGLYVQNGVYDVFTEGQLKYGAHLSRVTATLTGSDIVTTAHTYAGEYLKSRTQYMINSELKTSSDGRAYYEFISRGVNVATNVYGSWKFAETKNKVQRVMKLYVIDAAAGKFYTEKNGVRTALVLGSTEVFDLVTNVILAKGVVDKYEAVLNNIPQQTVERLADDQQVLFLSVYKGLKTAGDIVAVA